MIYLETTFQLAQVMSQ